MKDFYEPDFEIWAYKMKSPDTSHTDFVSDLKELFNQARSLGHREGFDHGVNTGWCEIQDADPNWLYQVADGNQSTKQRAVLLDSLKRINRHEEEEDD